MSDAPTRTTNRGSPRSQPNYAARRMLVSTILITMVVAGIVVAWRVVNGGDGGGSSTAGSWDQIALINRSTGDITFVDDSGEAAGSLVGAGRVGTVHANGDRLALVGTDRVVLAANDGEMPIDIPIVRGNNVTALATLDSFHLAVGSSTGGNVTIIDAVTGDVYDVGALAGQASPLMFAETLRHSTDGTAFAVADAANFQTIVVRPVEPDPTFFPDQPVAIGQELIATSQVVGQEADVTLFDDERNAKGRATIEIPAGGVMVGNDLIVVSIEGTVSRVARDAQEAERVGDVAVPAGARINGVRPTADGDRLLVFGSVFQAVIDLDGKTVFTTTFTSPVEPVDPALGWTCLPIGGGAEGGGGWHSLIVLETGEQIADLTGLDVTGTASDGCTVIGERAGVTEVVTAEGTVRLGNDRFAQLGPDGRSVVRQTMAGDLELVRIDDDLELEDPIDLSAVQPPNVMVAFLSD